jgi:hypothetical protein
LNVIVVVTTCRTLTSPFWLTGDSTRRTIHSDGEYGEYGEYSDRPDSDCALRGVAIADADET